MLDGGAQKTLTVCDVLEESAVCAEERLLWWVESELEDKTEHRVCPPNQVTPQAWSPCVGWARYKLPHSLRRSPSFTPITWEPSPGVLVARWPNASPTPRIWNILARKRPVSSNHLIFRWRKNRISLRTASALTTPLNLCVREQGSYVQSTCQNQSLKSHQIQNSSQMLFSWLNGRKRWTQLRRHRVRTQWNPFSYTLL